MLDRPSTGYVRVQCRRLLDTPTLIPVIIILHFVFSSGRHLQYRRTSSIPVCTYSYLQSGIGGGRLQINTLSWVRCFSGNRTVGGTVTYLLRSCYTCGTRVCLTSCLRYYYLEYLPVHQLSVWSGHRGMRSLPERNL
jgi:hypothetical protein